jgi:hypothetical protein
MTAWKTILLATQWLLLSAQTIPPDVNVDWTPPLNPKPYQYPMAVQEKQLPPKEFDHEYDGELTIKYMIEEDIYRNCRLGVKPGGGRPLACARAYLELPPSSTAPMGASKSCAIYMMTEAAYARLGWSYDIILRHEIGHCNGWHHDPR